MSGRVLFGVAGGVLLLALTGCEGLPDLLSSMPRPGAKVQGVSLQDLTLQGAALKFDVAVSNPYSVALPLVAMDYSLASGGTALLSGTHDQMTSIPARQTQIVPVTASLRFADVLKVLQSVKPGAVVPYNAKLNAKVNAPGVGDLNLPLSYEGKLPVPTAPTLELQQIGWQKLTLTEATAMMKLGITNLNQFPVDLSRFSYSLQLAGHPVAALRLDQAVKFTQGGKQTLELPLSFAPSQLGLAMFSALQKGSADYAISGLMDVNTPFGAMQWPVKREGVTTFTR